MAKKKKAPKKRRVHKRKAVKRRPVKRAKKRKVARRRPRRKVSAKPAATPRRKKRKSGRRVVKQVERRSVERVMTGRRKRRRSTPRKRSVRMAGTRRRRSVGKSGGNGMLIALAIGAGALYLMSRNSTPTYPSGNYATLPPLTQTSNYTRNTQSQDIVNYALAAGLAIDAITKLIDKLNTSSDQEVQNTYDVVNTSGADAFQYIA